MSRIPTHWCKEQCPSLAVYNRAYVARKGRGLIPYIQIHGDSEQISYVLEHEILSMEPYAIEFRENDIDFQPVPGTIYFFQQVTQRNVGLYVDATCFRTWLHDLDDVLLLNGFISYAKSIGLTKEAVDEIGRDLFINNTILAHYAEHDGDPSFYPSDLEWFRRTLQEVETQKPDISSEINRTQIPDQTHATPEPSVHTITPVPDPVQASFEPELPYSQETDPVITKPLSIKESLDQDVSSDIIQEAETTKKSVNTESMNDDQSLSYSDNEEEDRDDDPVDFMQEGMMGGSVDLEPESASVNQSKNETQDEETSWYEEMETAFNTAYATEECLEEYVPDPEEVDVPYHKETNVMNPSQLTEQEEKSIDEEIERELQRINEQAKQKGDTDMATDVKSEPDQIKSTSDETSSLDSSDVSSEIHLVHQVKKVAMRPKPLIIHAKTSSPEDPSVSTKEEAIPVSQADPEIVDESKMVCDSDKPEQNTIVDTRDSEPAPVQPVSREGEGEKQNVSREHESALNKVGKEKDTSGKSAGLAPDRTNPDASRVVPAQQKQQQAPQKKESVQFAANKQNKQNSNKQNNANTQGKGNANGQNNQNRQNGQGNQNKPNGQNAQNGSELSKSAKLREKRKRRKERDRLRKMEEVQHGPDVVVDQNAQFSREALRRMGQPLIIRGRALTQAENAENLEYLRIVRSLYKDLKDYLAQMNSGKYKMLLDIVGKCLAKNQYDKQLAEIYYRMNPDRTTEIYQKLIEVDTKVNEFNLSYIHLVKPVRCRYCDKSWEEDISFMKPGTHMIPCRICGVDNMIEIK